MAVRKNPHVNRGPEVPCENCPQPEPYQNGRVLSPGLVTLEAENERLWNWIFYGTSTCVSIIQGYYDMGMPNIPVDQVIHLRNRLDTLLQKVQRENDDESQSSTNL
jgi:hypothetical protein